MTQRRLTRVYAVAAIAALALAACGDAFEDENEATPDERSPDDVDNISVAMRPAAAEIFDFDTDDDEREFIKLTFTKEIQEFDEDGEGLFIQGFDPDDFEEAETAELVEDDTRSLILGFEEDTNLPSFTIAAVEDGIVEDAEGNENVQGAVALGGGPTVKGPTAAPELVSVEVERARNRIDYQFDERLDESAREVDISDFGFYTADGSVHTGDEFVSIEEREVVVEFDEEDGDQVEDAERTFAREGAAQDEQDMDSISGALGGATAAPDLQSVAPVEGSDTQWDFAFDEPVEVEEEEGFVVVRREGEREEAEEVENLDERTVRATFPDVEDVSEEVVLAVAEEGAVNAVEPEETDNTVGAVRLGREEDGGVGATAGPDLVAAEIVDVSTGRVRFLFDEAVEEDDPDEEDFFVITETGEVESAEEIVEVGDEDERFVIVTFEETEIAAAAGFSVDAGAVEGLEGEPNPVGTIAAAASGGG